MHARSSRMLNGWKLGAVALAFCAMTAAPVRAQTTGDSVVATTTTTTETEREGSFPWGLLGLLGLAGLLGRRKTEEVHTHRETIRPVETHRAAPVTGHTGHVGPEVDRTVIRPDDTSGTGGTMGGGTRL